MATAESVLSAREGGAEHPEDSIVRLVTLDIDSPNMVEPLFIVKNSTKIITLGWGVDQHDYVPYYFTEVLPTIKPKSKPEMTISFMQVSEEQETALIDTASVYPWPTVTRKTWEVDTLGVAVQTSEFLFPMPLRQTTITAGGTIEVLLAEDDLDDVPLNSTVYTTTDHPTLKTYTG